MRSLVLVFFLFSSVTAYAQYNNIRQYLSPKYQNAVTTVEMRQAAQAEGQIWQNLRKVVYGQLDMALSQQGKAALAERKKLGKFI